MTDQTTSTAFIADDQTSLSAQQPKKTFFGGEVNFNDPATFKAVEGSPAPVEEEDFSLTFWDEVSPSESSSPTEAEKPEPVSDTTFEDFDPFGDDEIVEPVQVEAPSEPVVEEPIVSEPVIDELFAEEPLVSEPVVEETTVEEPVVEEIAFPVDPVVPEAPVSNELDEYSAEEAGVPAEEEEAEPNEESEDTENTEDVEDSEPVEENEEVVEPKEEEALEYAPLPSTGNALTDKFLTLITTARNIFTLQEDKQSFTILWGKNAKSLLEYFVYLVEDEEDHIDLFIKKVETDNEAEEEDEHLLQWSYHTQTQHLDIFVDEILLYQLEGSEEERKNMQIIDKLDKFWFLFETQYTDLNKAYQEKKETENKKKQLHEIFRNF